MNKGVLFSNGNAYAPHWGGDFRKVTEPKSLGNRHLVGDYSSIRKYHKTRLIEVNGVEWCVEVQKDKQYSKRTGCVDYHLWHWQYRSSCGRFKVCRYTDSRGYRYFMAYECIGSPSGMNAQFGNYINEIGSKQFPSALECLKAVSALAK